MLKVNKYKKYKELKVSFSIKILLISDKKFLLELTDIKKRRNRETGVRKFSKELENLLAISDLYKNL